MYWGMGDSWVGTVNLMSPLNHETPPCSRETQVCSIWSGGLVMDGSALGTHPTGEEASDRPATRWNPKVEV